MFILFRYIPIFLFLLLFGVSAGCRSDDATNPDMVEIVELEEFETILNLESELLALPVIIKYDDSSGHLFVYDIDHANVFELDLISGVIANEYGGKGSGPGEYQQVNSIHPVEDHLFLVDHHQHFIHKYDRTGNVVSSLDYGAIVMSFDPLMTLSSMTVGGVIRAININNQPFVTLQGDVLLRPGGDRLDQTIYERRNWEGDHLSDIGVLPEGSMFISMPDAVDEYESAIMNRDIPSILKPNAFPVHDRANPEEYFLVYSAVPMITKYNTAGVNIWESKVSGIPELDVIADDYFERMQQQLQNSQRTSIEMLRKYTSGVSSKRGDLYLATYTDPTRQLADSNPSEPLWIHRFDSAGELDRRYKIVSEDVGIASIFDIDFAGGRIFVVTAEGEIRAYPM